MFSFSNLIQKVQNKIEEQYNQIPNTRTCTNVTLVSHYSTHPAFLSKGLGEAFARGSPRSEQQIELKTPNIPV